MLFPISVASLKIAANVISWQRWSTATAWAQTNKLSVKTASDTSEFMYFSIKHLQNCVYPLYCAMFLRLNYIYAAWWFMKSQQHNDVFNFFSTLAKRQQTSQKSLFFSPTSLYFTSNYWIPFFCKIAVFFFLMQVHVSLCCCLHGANIFFCSRLCAWLLSDQKRLYFSQPLCNGQNHGEQWITYRVPRGLEVTVMSYYLTIHCKIWREWYKIRNT